MSGLTIESNTLEVKKKIKEVYNCNIYSLNPFINFGLEGHKYDKYTMIDFIMVSYKNTEYVKL